MGDNFREYSEQDYVLWNQAEFKSQLHYLQTMWPGKNYLTSLCPNILIFKMKKITVHTGSIRQ